MDPSVPIEFDPDRILVQNELLTIYIVSPTDQSWREVGLAVIDDLFVFDVVFNLDVQRKKPPQNRYIAPKRILPLEMYRVRPYQIASMFNGLLFDSIRIYAIENVYFEINDSLLNNDVLAHRLGLIPLVELGPIDHTKPITFQLDRESSDQNLVLYSNDLQSSEPNLQALPGIRLVILLPRQRVRFIAEAIESTGAEHSKWKTVIRPAYRETSYPNVFRYKMELTGAISADNVLHQATDNMLEEYAVRQ